MRIMNSICDMFIHKLLLMLSSSDLFFAFSSSFARFWALMLSSFIDVSLCSIDAAHMHRRGFDNQMWIYLWPRLMLLTYASHRAWGFSFPTPYQLHPAYVSLPRIAKTPALTLILCCFPLFFGFMRIAAATCSLATFTNTDILSVVNKPTSLLGNGS